MEQRPAIAVEPPVCAAVSNSFSQLQIYREAQPNPESRQKNKLADLREYEPVVRDCQ